VYETRLKAVSSPELGDPPLEQPAMTATRTAADIGPIDLVIDDTW
jgi:hypothetical protein